MVVVISLPPGPFITRFSDLVALREPCTGFHINTKMKSEPIIIVEKYTTRPKRILLDMNSLLLSILLSSDNYFTSIKSAIQNEKI
jgi:hypothetical protein